ncbi:hypothetical protein MJD09_01840 [bacterium]|nr:hypothetical protein [bacterium]
MFSALDLHARPIIKLLVSENHRQLWGVISRFFQVATSEERRRLRKLVGPHSFDSDHHVEGPLFGIPETDCIKWAKQDPEHNSPFLCFFYPMLETRENGEHVWHPALERLTNELAQLKNSAKL